MSQAIRLKLQSEQIEFRQLLSAKDLSGFVSSKNQPPTQRLDAVRRQIEQLHQVAPERRIGGVINLLPLMSFFQQKERLTDLALISTRLLQILESDLRESAKVGGGWVINLTGIDGLFGLNTPDQFRVMSAHSTGFFKSLAREWPEVRVKNIDVEMSELDEILAAEIADEIFVETGSIEVGIGSTGRRHLCLAAESAAPDSDSLSLDRDSVILITGGAAGIAADVSLELASRFQCQLVLVGRSELALDESPETIRLKNESDIRNHFVAQMRSAGLSRPPIEIEKQVQSLMKERVIRGNIQRMRAAGAAVSYHSLDVSRSADFEKLLTSIYQQFGRIDGVIHAAGLIEDRLLGAKTPESLQRVFETKVESAEVLASSIDAAALKFLVFFSSVSARFGNAGQTDYAAANEHLNKLARSLDRKWPGRVVSINWGPWDSGMVSDNLKMHFRQRGVDLVRPEEGVKAFFDELCATRSRVPEVVIARTVSAIAGPDGCRIQEAT